MSEERPRMQRQLEELQSRIAELEDAILATQKRTAALGRRPQVRIGQTVRTSLGGYPLQDSGATAFGVKFQDPNFVEIDGARSVSGPFLTASAARVAMTIPPSYIEEGQPVVVIEVDGQHYIIGRSSPLGPGGADHDCICEIINTLEAEEAISVSAADILREICDCDQPDDYGCENCDGARPESFTGSVTGAVSVYGQSGTVNDIPTDVIDELRDWVNSTELTLEGDACSLTDRKELEVTRTTGGVTKVYVFHLNYRYALGVEGKELLISVTTPDFDLRDNFFPLVFPVLGTLGEGYWDEDPQKTPPYDCGSTFEPVWDTDPVNLADTFYGGIDFSAATPSIHRVLPPPPQKTYNKRYSCSNSSGGVMPELTLTITGLVDTASEPQYDGWSDYVNGVYRFDHRSGGANGFASICEPAIFLKVPDNSRLDPSWPRGPLVIIFQPKSPEADVALRIRDNTQENNREIVLVENSANLFPAGADNKPLTGSTYSDWTVLKTDDADLENWLSNATITLNP